MDFKVLPHPYNKYSINKLGEVINNKTNKKLKVWINHGGYKNYTLRNEYLNQKRNLSVHRLLGITFINNPNSYPCIDHIDRNKKNNDLNNLRWVSYQMNSLNKDCNNPLGRGITLSRNGKKYNVNLFRKGEKKWIGVYDTLSEAKLNYTKSVEKWYELNQY